MRRQASGFTMVEVMISMAVLAFVLLAFLGVMQSSATMSASSKETSVAAFQLQAAIEATFAVPFEDFKAIFGPSALPDTGDSGAKDDHPSGKDPKGRDWKGHLCSRPSGTGDPSPLPDFCQTKNVNHTWKPTPVNGWTTGDTLPLLDQHIWIEWISQSTSSSIDWVEYRLTITWTNYRGRDQEYSIVTRRSR